MRSRLEQIFKESDLGLTAFAKSIDLAPSSLSEYFNEKKGKTVNIKPEALAQLSIKYNVNLNWLLTGEGEKKLNTRQPATRMVTNSDGGMTFETFDSAMDELDEKQKQLVKNFIKMLKESGSESSKKSKSKLKNS